MLVFLPFLKLKTRLFEYSRSEYHCIDIGATFSAAESDRQMEINYVNLRALEENTKNLAKEMNHYEECVGKLQDFELNLSSSLLNSSLCREDPPLR